jgi:hypothetical protein
VLRFNIKGGKMRNCALRLGVLAAAVVLMACNEALAPKRAVADLDIVVPNLRNDARANYGVQRVNGPLSWANSSGRHGPAFDGMPSGLSSDSGWAEQAAGRLSQTAGFTADPAAYGEGLFYYRGTSASVTENVTVSYNNAQVAQQSGSASDWHLVPPFPGVDDYVLDAQVAIGVGGQCGNTVSSVGTGKTWFTLGLMSWGEFSETQSKVKGQPACLTQQAGSSREDIGDQWYDCYWIDWYDAEGNYLYTQDLGCFVEET